LGHLWVHHQASLKAAAGRCMLLFLLCFLVVVLCGGLPDHLVAPALCCLLVAALLDQRRVWSRVLAVRPLLYLGEISYSTYLIHYFVKDWVKFLSAEIGLLQWLIYLAVVMLMSVLLYRHV